MIAIIDYGMGNLRSVQKAFEYLGYNACVTSNPNEIKDADHVVLPGVGAFCDAIENLNKTGLSKVINEVISTGRPFLGICLGMQLLFEKSYEGGLYKGLGIFKGAIRKLPDDVKVPHMGWNNLIMKQNPIFDGLDHETYVYFVHSYYADAEYSQDVIAEVDYGLKFAVAVAKNNVFGLQFHPEKSGDSGLKILKNFGGLK